MGAPAPVYHSYHNPNVFSVFNTNYKHPEHLKPYAAVPAAPAPEPAYAPAAPAPAPKYVPAPTYAPYTGEKPTPKTYTFKILEPVEPEPKTVDPAPVDLGIDLRTGAEEEERGGKGVDLDIETPVENTLVEEGIEEVIALEVDEALIQDPEAQAADEVLIEETE